MFCHFLCSVVRSIGLDGGGLPVLTGKPFLQPRHAPVLFELSQRAGAELCPRTLIQIQQPRPQLRVMMPQVPQLPDPLEGAAPARGAAVDTVQAAEVKAPVIADLQRLDLGDAPVYQGVVKVLAPMGLVCRDAYILLKLMRSLEPVDLLVDKVGFELAGTPADPDTRPAVAVGRDAQPRTVFQAGRFLLGFLEHHVLETLRGTQDGDVQAALSEQVLVHLGDSRMIFSSAGLFDIAPSVN